MRTDFKPTFYFLAEFNNNEHELLEALEMSLDHGAVELVEWLFAFKTFCHLSWRLRILNMVYLARQRIS